MASFFLARDERTYVSYTRCEKKKKEKMVIVSKYVVPRGKKYKPILSNNEVIKVKFRS